MKPAILFILSSFFIVSATACKEVHIKAVPAGVNVMIHDIPCEEVKDRLIKECKKQHLPFEWADQQQGLLSIGPVLTTPLPEDSFLKTEEKVRLEIKCSDPLSTRLSLRNQLKCLTADNQWLEIKEADKLNAYGKRFLDRLLIN